MWETTPRYLNADPLYWLSAIQSTNTAHFNQLTQELKLASDNSGPFKWLAGLYWYDSRNYGSEYLFTSLPISFYQINVNNNQLKGESAYGQVTYSITDSLRVTAGARSAARLLAPDQQDRCRRGSNDLGRIAAQNQAAETSSPVCAHHDQIGRPCLRMSNDDLRRPLAVGVEQNTVAIDTACGDELLGLIQIFLTRVAQGCQQDVTDRAGRKLVMPVHQVDDMDQMHDTGAVHRDLDDFMQRGHRGSAAVDWNQHLSIHAVLRAESGGPFLRPW